MKKTYDCFLYNNEIELLEIRLQLLSDVVEKFIIVWASETFTGRKKDQAFPWDNKIVSNFKDKIELIIIEKLKGKNAWEKEWYSRNRLVEGLNDLAYDDLVMISDIDEIPRPSILNGIRTNNEMNDIKVLGLDYYNFKFNYKLVHGTQVIWAGPVICYFKDFITPQKLRDQRWHALYNPQQLIEDAGWHFSFLTASDNVTDKLASFSHQESEVQSRTDNVDFLMQNRQGFSDHLQPGSVWAIVDFSVFKCEKLSRLVSEYVHLYLPELPDEEILIAKKIRASTHFLCTYERNKVLFKCTLNELVNELIRRFLRRFKSVANT